MLPDGAIASRATETSFIIHTSYAIHTLHFIAFQSDQANNQVRTTFFLKRQVASKDTSREFFFPGILFAVRKETKAIVYPS
jgi:hypothetical protein